MPPSRLDPKPVFVAEVPKVRARVKEPERVEQAGAAVGGARAHASSREDTQVIPMAALSRGSASQVAPAFQRYALLWA